MAVPKRTATVNIKCGMLRAGYDAHDMAKACGVSERTWFRWMEDPGLLTLDRLWIIAAKLSVDPAELIDGEDETPVRKKTRKRKAG